MIVTQLSHLCFKVSNLQKIKNFFTKNLKLKIAHEYINDKKKIYGYFFFAGNKTFIEVFKKRKKEKIKYDESSFHLSFKVENIKKLSKYFNNLNFKNVICRGKTDKTLQFWINGPDGLKVEFQQYDKFSKLTKFIKK